MSSAENNCSSLLSSSEIKRYKLIDTIEDKNLKSASYDLTLGDMHYVYEESGHWKAFFLGDLKTLIEKNANISPTSPLVLSPSPRSAISLVIPPFGSAIIQLAETVDLLSAAENNKVLIAGRFDLKLKSIYKGLISQQATQVEPCYKGKLYCFIYNLSSCEIILTKGKTVATIEFSRVGESLEDSDRAKIIADTISLNQEKYTGPFAIEGKGIGDIRWLYEQEMLPTECGIAPIYHLVGENLKNAVNAHLEKSTTIDDLSVRVGTKINEKQSVVRLILSLVIAIITFFTTNLALEVRSELRYFSEELAFLSSIVSENMVPSSLEAITDHTEQLRCLLSFSAFYSAAFTVIVAVILLIIFFSYIKPSKGQKWVNKKNALMEKSSFKEYKQQKKEQVETIEHINISVAQLNKITKLVEEATEKYRTAMHSLNEVRSGDTTSAQNDSTGESGDSP